MPSRGNKQTRGGPGRHTTVYTPESAKVTAKILGCMGCNRPFRSRGPWNRFCGRCHEQLDDGENVKTYKTPKEWPTGVFEDY